MASSERSTKLRCIIIGAGVSGILIAQKLKEAFPDKVEFWIFEKNEDVGGTWFENRYPGCACDVPSHIYQFSFCPNPNWSSYYASSKEIQSYLRAVTFHYGLNEYISLKSPVNRAVWNDQTSLWTVSVEGQGDFDCEILMNASGILNHIQFPAIPNLDLFQGPLLHTASWNEEVSLRGKRIAIIGGGASAIQTLPAVQGVAEHVDIYIRTPSWIAPPAEAGEHAERNHVYTSAEKRQFREDPEYSARIRKKMESSCNKLYGAFLKGSKEQSSVRKRLEENMRRQIRSSDLQDRLIPRFEVGCRRINPGEPYLEALQRSNVQPVFESIDEVTNTGICAGGRHRETDIIIAATGFDTSFRPRFPIIGRDGIDLRDLWQKDPVAYFGLAVAGFPNYLVFLGPNTPISNGSLMGVLEGTANYFVRLLGKFMDQKALSFDVRLDAQTDFDSHTQEIMKDMVWTGACRSWYKSREGKVTALWPGSSLHYRESLAANRWEDFDWRHAGNRFDYWGQGFAKIEQSESDSSKADTTTPDLAYYIQPREPLPLEAYYLAAKGPLGRATVKALFRAGDQIGADAGSGSQSPVADSFSDSSWESKVAEVQISQAVGFSI